MISAFGYEELCSRAFFAALVDRLATAGMPSLRFDLPGTGNALDTDATGIEDWRAATVAGETDRQHPGGVGSRDVSSAVAAGARPQGVHRGQPAAPPFAGLAPHQVAVEAGLHQPQVIAARQRSVFVGQRLLLPSKAIRRRAADERGKRTGGATIPRRAGKNARVPQPFPLGRTGKPETSDIA